MLELPSIAVPLTNGGYFVMGIGTRSNNTPAGVTAYSADAQAGEFITTYNGTTAGAFIDSGSNAYYFTNASIPDCPSPNGSWFCPLDSRHRRSTRRWPAAQA